MMITKPHQRPISALTAILALAALGTSIAQAQTVTMPSTRVSPQDWEPLPASVTFHTLAKFNVKDGHGPGNWAQPGAVEGRDGNLYGTTAFGGAHSGGTVFQMTPGGTLTTLHNFCAEPGCADGNGPAGLVLGANGNFYGTIYANGANNGGTIFKIAPDGTLTTLYSFCSLANCIDGSGPVGLARAAEGSFYGTTGLGGIATTCPYSSGGCGTVFKITPGGDLSTLYSFCSQPVCADGANPLATVIQATDGNLYGTTEGGGSYGGGTVFRLTPGGTLTTVRHERKGPRRAQCV